MLSVSFFVDFVGVFCGFVYLNGLVALVGRVGRRSFCRTGDNKIKTRGLMRDAVKFVDMVMCGGESIGLIGLIRSDDYG